jgi:hypothetical protein
MSQIQQECIRRAITRLCHFTQSRNMAHIFDEPFGLFSTKTLRENDMPFNPTDPERFDGRDDLICCSVEYPNTYYFDRVKSKEPLFKDWVILYIDPAYLWHPATLFCPCNAARECGVYVKSGLNGFQALFAQTSPGISFTRSTKHLPAAPTDIQAEVLIADPIPIEAITGIVVQSDEQAQKEFCRFRLQGISIDKAIYVVPDFYIKDKIKNSIQSGIRVTETLYNNGGHHVR